jgi:putative peptide zinc metalloprotease protein
MSETERFLSSSWYRVAPLKPRLRQHVTVRMHRYRGHLWYVIGDGMNNRVHRVSPAAYVLVASMDGKRTLDSLWSEAAVTLGEQAPSQDQVIQLLGQLHSNDLIAGDVPPDARELFERQGKLNRSKLLQWILNPLALRFPMVDPNQFLDRTLPLIRPLISRWGGVLWLLTVLPALVLTARYWPELTDNIGDRVLPAGNLLLIAAIYPVIKLLHELGHGYTTKAQGGEVHELGVMLLVMLPMPYVEVSASAGFRGKWTRCLVGAAGIMVELFIAAIALYVWLLVEPGFVRALAFNVMLTASVSSLLFNGNPLLRYDGYYVLADMIEVPNLAQRGRQYWSYLARRHLFGTPQTRDFPATTGERVWFLLYTPVAAVYRISVTVGIALVLMSKYLAAGVVLALWGLVTGVILPVARGLWSVITSPNYTRNRTRAVAATGGLIACGLALLFWLPMPLHTSAEGVVWLPDDAIVRAGTNGFVRAVQTSPGTEVTRGQIVIASEDPDLTTQVTVLRAREAELTAKLESVRFSDRVEAVVTEMELTAVRTDLARQRYLAGMLNARAGTDGVFAMALPDDAPGRFFKRGDVLGYVVPREGARIVRAAVSQEDIELVRQHVREASIKLADGLDQGIQVRSIREVPSGKDQLPSAAMGTGGGGEMLTDPRDQHGLTALNRVFLLDLELASPVPRAGFGGRAYVRFDLQWEPLGEQLWRRVRQLLLSRVEI